MELSHFLETQTGKDLTKIGIFAIAHLAISANRRLRKSIQSPAYDRISLPVEHVISHATLALGASGGFDLIGMPLFWNVIDSGILLSFVKGMAVDYYIPARRTAQPQWGQMLSDVIGCGVYAAGLNRLI